MKLTNPLATPPTPNQTWQTNEICMLSNLFHVLLAVAFCRSFSRKYTFRLTNSLQCVAAFFLYCTMHHHYYYDLNVTVMKQHLDVTVPVSLGYLKKVFKQILYQAFAKMIHTLYHRIKVTHQKYKWLKKKWQSSLRVRLEESGRRMFGSRASTHFPKMILLISVTDNLLDKCIVFC